MAVAAELWGVGAAVSGSGSRWVGPGSRSQPDGRADGGLDIEWMSGLTGSGGSLCFKCIVIEKKA